MGWISTLKRSKDMASFPDQKTKLDSSSFVRRLCFSFYSVRSEGKRGGKYVKRVLVFLFIIVLGVLAIYNNMQTKNGSPDQIPRPGFTAPHFSLSALNNQSYLVAGKRDKPVILNFWASWCGPCRQEAPDLKMIYEKYQDQLDFYAINMTANDDLESAKSFVKEFGLPFPILLDEKGVVSKQYQVISIPTTYFIDTDGIIKQKIIGVTDRGSFEEYVKELVR